MDLEQFNFNLPEFLIAQTPLKKRDASKLLVAKYKQKNIHHDQFKNIFNYLQPGDCLVFNDTKVLPARLFGIKKDTGAKIEILLLNEDEKDHWEVLAKPARKLPKGSVISFGAGRLTAICVKELDQGRRILHFKYEGSFFSLIDEIGVMPLPPYIKKELSEQDRYQTVYAKKRGSAAAPTAGLHFTESTLKALKEKDVMITYLTLHVGLGTFRPIAVSNIEDHQMHEEYFELSEQTANLLNQVRAKEGRIIAVGTTSARVLEAIAKNSASFQAQKGWTDIFIYPPYTFKAIDGLITNFHLPQSTLLMLVSALAGREFILQAYEEAIKEQYRFFSFGDAMLILP